MNPKLLSLLGIAERAGKLHPGFSRCSNAVKSAKAYGVILCSDLSAKSQKEVRFLCDKYRVPLWTPGITIEELSAAIGFKAGVCAVCDPGFAQRAADLITQAMEG